MRYQLCFMTSLAILALALACTGPEPTATATPTPTPTPVPTLTPTPPYTPKVVSFPFMWREGGKLFDGRYLDAVEITVSDFMYEGPSPRISGYHLYVVHYSVKYTLYKEWNDFDGYRAIVGPSMEVVTDKGHLYGRNAQSIAIYYLTDFLPNEERTGALTFDIAPDENPVELRHYESFRPEGALFDELRIAYIWKLDVPAPP